MDIKTSRAIYLTATTVSGLMMISIASKIAQLERHATWVDLGALAVVSLLTGIFLTLFLSCIKHSSG